MLGVMKKQLDINRIPWGYELCFNADCQLREKCLRYQAYLLKPAERLGGPAVYPDAWKNGECSRFCEDKLVQVAWGFSKIYKNVPYYQRPEARRCVKNYFSSGNGPYYRYHHGENKPSPSSALPTVWLSITTKPASTSPDGVKYAFFCMRHE